MGKYRQGRINEEFKREISDIIQNNLKDPRINSMISVTSVEVTKDLRYAKVYISIFGNENNKEETLEALKNSTGFIRREVGKRIKLRYTPEIIIELDKSIERGMHIEGLLHKIKENEKNEEQ